MTCNDIFLSHIVSIHINVYQNWFINECARRNIAKIPPGQKTPPDVRTDFL